MLILKTFFNDDAIPLHNFKFWKNCSIVKQDLFSQSFHSCKLFHERVSYAKNGTERQVDWIKYVFKIWFNQSEKSSIVDVRLGSKYISVNITLQLIFYISYNIS